jgi:hypothetical protein
VSLNYRTFRLISAGVHGGELAHTGYEMFEGHGAGR